MGNRENKHERVNKISSIQSLVYLGINKAMIRRDEDDRFVFFKVAEGYGGHTQNLAIFETSNTLNPQESTLHHIALNIALEDYESEKMRLEGLGLKVNATEHEWLHVRSLYFYDPEGNHLEFVAYDESVR